MKQKGQDIIEFALLLPVFLLLLYSVMYAGFLYGDYMTMSGIVRSAAREAAVVGETTTTKNSSGKETTVNNFNTIKESYVKVIGNTHMTTHLYTFQGMTIKSTGKNPTDDAPANSVYVSVTMKLTDDVLFVNALKNLGVDAIVDSYVIDYYMYDETTKTEST